MKLGRRRGRCRPKTSIARKSNAGNSNAKSTTVGKSEQKSLQDYKPSTKEKLSGK